MPRIAGRAPATIRLTVEGSTAKSEAKQVWFCMVMMSAPQAVSWRPWISQDELHLSLALLERLMGFKLAFLADNRSCWRTSIDARD